MAYRLRREHVQLLRLHELLRRRVRPGGAGDQEVVVGPTFFEVPIDAKEGFVETLNCFLLAGKQGECVNFNVLHWQTGKAVGRYSYCRFKMH